jgi:hypothetical protein
MQQPIDPEFHGLVSQPVVGETPITGAVDDAANFLRVEPDFNDTAYLIESGSKPNGGGDEPSTTGTTPLQMVDAADAGLIAVTAVAAPMVPAPHSPEQSPPPSTFDDNDALYDDSTDEDEADEDEGEVEVAVATFLLVESEFNQTAYIAPPITPPEPVLRADVIASAAAAAAAVEDERDAAAASANRPLCLDVEDTWSEMAYQSDQADDGDLYDDTDVEEEEEETTLPPAHNDDSQNVGATTATPLTSAATPTPAATPAAPPPLAAAGDIDADADLYDDTDDEEEDGAQQKHEAHPSTTHPQQLEGVGVEVGMGMDEFFRVEPDFDSTAYDAGEDALLADCGGVAPQTHSASRPAAPAPAAAPAARGVVFGTAAAPAPATGGGFGAASVAAGPTPAGLERTWSDIAYDSEDEEGVGMWVGNTGVAVVGEEGAAAAATPAVAASAATDTSSLPPPIPTPTPTPTVTTVTTTAATTPAHFAAAATPTLDLNPANIRLGSPAWCSFSDRTWVRGCTALPRLALA